MSELAIFRTTQALRRRIGEAFGTANDVHVGSPLAADVAGKRASLLLFHLQVNQSLRNEPYVPAPTMAAPAPVPGPSRDALPLDLRYMITVFRLQAAVGAGSDPTELTTLGRIVQRLQVEPMLSGEGMDGQAVRVTPEPYPMEEISRVWGLFPNEAYRTSVVYLASPVYVDAGPVLVGPPVEERTLEGGQPRTHPTMFPGAADEREGST